VITNDVSDYGNLFVRIAHIICNHPLYFHMTVCMEQSLLWEDNSH